MPRRSILTATERESSLALPEAKDELIRHYTFSEPEIWALAMPMGGWRSNLPSSMEPLRS